MTLHTCSGNGVSRSSTSSSAYVRIVFSEWRRCSSLKFWEVPTSDDRDMVTCIFTRAKFWSEGRIRTDCDSYPSNILNMYCRHGTLTWLWQEHTNTDCFTMQKQCPDLHFQSQSSASWAGTERQRRDFWQNRHYCCSDAEDAGTGLHKAQYPLQTASLGTTHTNKQHFVTLIHIQLLSLTSYFIFCKC